MKTPKRATRKSSAPKIKNATLLGRVTVIGYGSQGSAIAQNLRDSHIDVTVALPTGRPSRRKASADGFTVTTVSKAVASAETLVFAFPDHQHGRMYTSEIQPHLRAGQTFVFLHGTTVHFKLVTPPQDVDVIMLAPHGPGLSVREQFVSGKSEMSAFWSVHQDHSKKAKQKLLAFASAIGITDAKKLIQTTFRDESIGDLFGEQVALCGGLTELVHSAFQVLHESGISADNAYLEVSYQLDLIVNLIKRFGIEGMYQRISVAAKYGSLNTGPKIINAQTRERMRAVFQEIESGEFPKALNSLTESDIQKLNNDLKKMTSPEFEKAAKKFAKK